jgi:uncharacterized damage-inducible protein DinB
MNEQERNEIMNKVDSVDRGTEYEQLPAFLDLQRSIIFRKVDGVGDEDLRRHMTPTGLSLLGLVKHLGYVEMGWFQEHFLGEKIEVPWTDEDRDADFRIEPNETTADVLAFYQKQIERSRQIVAEHSFDEVSKKDGRDVPKEEDSPSLRWIIIHMIEETARHAGHADIMREAIDGSVGE